MRNKVKWIVRKEHIFIFLSRSKRFYFVVYPLFIIRVQQTTTNYLQIKNFLTMKNEPTA